MEIILQLFQSLYWIVILTSLILPSFVALLAVKRIEDEEITDWLARTVQAWCKIVLDISLVWGIALACTGLIGMTLNNDSSDSLTESVVIVFSCVVTAGLAAVLAFTFE